MTISTRSFSIGAASFCVEPTDSGVTTTSLPKSTSPIEAPKPGGDGSTVTPLATVNETTDAANNTSTTYSINVGDSFTGELNPVADDDWIALTLAAGEMVQINMNGSSVGGGTISDPYLRLYDSSGTLLAQNDDSNGTLNSQINFTATTAGTYYISAREFGDNNTGTYTITTSDGSYDPLDSIDWGSALADTSVSYYFAPNGFTADGITSEGFNAYQMGQFALALDVFASYTGLTFTEVFSSASADFIFILDTNEMPSNLYGYFNPPGETNEGVGAFNGNNIGSAPGGDLERGGFGFMVLIHELGHGFGLAHPHDTGGTSTVMPGVTSSASLGPHLLNQGVFTTMSYSAGFVSGPVGTARSGTLFGSQGGPMALDLAILQDRYGFNPTQNAGNTIFNLPTTNGTGTFWEAISDVSGIDTIVNPGAANSTIDLRSATLQGDFNGGGFISAVDGIQGGFTIVNTTVIENAIGGSGNDIIIGNDVGNGLTGGSGDDTLDGGAGNDLLNGDTGRDSLTGGSGNDTVNGGGGHDTISGGPGADTLRGNDGDDDISGGTFGDLIYGGNQHDTIRGEDGPDTIIGGSGNDSLIGGGHTDSILGGDGNDTIIGNLGNDTLEGGTGTDSITGGDGRDLISGNTGNDTLIGNKADDTIDGGGGSDSILGGDDNDSLIGQSGVDTIRGGNGNDYIEGNDFGDLLEGNGGLDTIMGGTGGDTIDGGGDADLIYGEDGDDIIIGAEGNDTLYGNNGNDTLIGQQGDDRLFGGSNADTFEFQGVFGDDTIQGFAHGTDDVSMVGYVQGDLTMSTSGGNTLVEVNGQSDSILFVGVILTDFSDFVFS
ncbi:pre-peptidase C-terminal domain-containing protein [Salipiger sp.]|uniref:pre-peptidase C-terminal domain-containing protein n=1 Tax=Salipiger sp. TaxID=2078585 RepID=UPI003A978B4A